MAKAKQLKATNGEDKEKFTRPMLAHLKLFNQLFPSECKYVTSGTHG